MQNDVKPSIGLFVLAHILAWVASIISIILVITQVDVFTKDFIVLLFLPVLFSGLALFSAFAHRKWRTKIGLTIWVAVVMHTFLVALGTSVYIVFWFFVPSMFSLLAAAYFRERKLQPRKPKQPQESWD